MTRTASITRLLALTFAATLVAGMCVQVAATLAAFAAPGDISTIAGTGHPGYAGDGGPATAATLNGPTGTAEDAAGNIYIADGGNHVVREIDTSGDISTFAGNGTDGSSGDGGPATMAQLSQPFALAFDASGDLYITDQNDPYIRKVNTSGIISTVAGTGIVGNTGDGGPAISAEINPLYMAFSGGDLYFTSLPGSIRKIDSSGNISTFVNGLNHPFGLAADGSGNFYVNLFGGRTVDEVDSSGDVTVVAGTGGRGDGGDGGPATQATFGEPYGLAYRSGSLYVSDFFENDVRKIDPAGTISTFAGTGTRGYSGDGGPATEAHVFETTGVSFANNGDLLISDFGNDAVRDVQAIPPDLLALSLSAPANAVESTGFVYQVTVRNPGSVGDATGVTVSDTLPPSVAYVGSTVSQGSCVAAASIVTCPLGPLAAGATATVQIDVTAQATPAVATDQASVTADQTDPNTADNGATATTNILNGSGVIYPLAGNGTAGYSGDGGPSTAALVSAPEGIRTDAAGNIYFSDANNNVVRKIDALGNITTFAGNGTAGFSGDGGAATTAELNDPDALAVDAAGDVFIADSGNERIRRVDPSGMITTVAGSDEGQAPGVFPAPLGNGGPATSAELDGIGGLAVDSAGNLYITDLGASAIRKVDGSTGMISLFLGHLVVNVPGLGDVSQGPRALVVDASNNLFITTNSGSVQKVDLATDALSVVAGNPDDHPSGGGTPGGDGGPATSAHLGTPLDVNVDAGDLYIADGGSDNAIRRVDTAGIISTVAGGPAGGYSGDGGPAVLALLNSPAGVAPLGHGSFVVSDTGNNAVRFVTGNADVVSLVETAPLVATGGGPIAYQLQVRNDGSAGDATAVVVRDPLPAGVTYVGVTASQGSCSQTARTVTCDLGTVHAVTTADVTVNVTAPAASVSLSNTVTVAASTVDPVTKDNTATATTFVNPADLAVSLAATPGGGVDVATPLAYTATVVNQGPQNATVVTLKDILPANLKFVSTSVQQGACSHSGATVTCSLAALAAGASTTVTINVKPLTAGVTINTATVSAAQADQFAFNNTASLNMFVSGVGCGETITRSITLTANIGPCGGDGVIIGADKINVNLGGHKIFGRGTGTGLAITDDLVGIRLPNRTGVTITGGTVSGFDTGIFLNSGDGNTITKMTVKDNIGQDGSFGPVFPDLGDGILIEHSSFNKITANLVDHNGTYDGIGVFGLDTDGNVIQANTVENTVTGIAHGDGEGVIINNFLATVEPQRGDSIADNNVTANTIRGNAASGISNVSNLNALIENNTVTGNGLTSSPSNGIGIQVGGVAQPDSNDTISGNHVSGNGNDGIQVLRPAFGNTVTGNVASSNNANNDASFNYEDTNGNCTANTWMNNTSTNGRVSPSCLIPSAAAATAQSAASGTAQVGSGPPLPQAGRRLPPVAG